MSPRNIDWRNQRGHLCESMAIQQLITDGYWVFTTTMLGPVDIVAIRGDPPEVRLFDVKSSSQRFHRGKKARIHRNRSSTQKVLGVQLIYVNPEIEEVFFSDHRDTDESAPD